MSKGGRGGVRIRRRNFKPQGLVGVEGKGPFEEKRKKRVAGLKRSGGGLVPLCALSGKQRQKWEPVCESKREEQKGNGGQSKIVSSRKGKLETQEVRFKKKRRLEKKSLGGAENGN